MPKKKCTKAELVWPLNFSDLIQISIQVLVLVRIDDDEVEVYLLPFRSSIFEFLDFSIFEVCIQQVAHQSIHLSATQISSQASKQPIRREAWSSRLGPKGWTSDARAELETIAEIEEQGGEEIGEPEA